MSKIKSKFNLSKISLKAVVGVIAVLILGLVAGSGIGINLAPDGDVTVETEYSIELSEEQVPALVENSNGEIEEVSAPTVEMVDGNNLIDECPEGEECGKGAFQYVDVTSPTTIKDSILGSCIDVDGYYGSQCWDASSAVAENMTGRRLSTCGTGAAKGMMDCWQDNAKDDFEVIWDASSLQPGDIVVFGGGMYGHTGIALGYYNNGYIALLGTNQGGSACAGGGSAANIINMSTKTFIGAYRWKEYIPKEESVPETSDLLPLSNCVQWHVAQGDTMGKIMLECENTIVYGEAMDAYAKTWFSLIMKPGQSVYEGWNSGTGYGLYAGDDIEHRTE